MPNQVFGPYSTTSWVNGTTAANATNMNHLETQASIALNGFNGDLVTPFVLSGIVASKDGTIANQLDVTSGRAYLKMSDNTVGLIATVASTASQFLTTTPSTTYYLFLNNDGTWQWSTTSTGPTNSLQICQATTDGSGNISVVTDKRTVNVSLLPTTSGNLSLPHALLFGSGVSTSQSFVTYSTVNHENEYWTPQTGATAQGHLFVGWDGAAMAIPLGIGSVGATAQTGISNAGAITKLGGQATVGSLGVSTVVRKIDDQVIAVTTETLLTSLTAPADAWYRISYSFNYSNPTPQKVIAKVSWTDPSAGGAAQNYFQDNFQGQLLSGSQTTAMANNQMVTCAPIPLRVKSGTTFGVYFQDPGGTPNDKISLLIERLT